MRTTSDRQASARAAARRRQRGQGLVELAFLVPVIALLWAAMIDLGRINVKKQQVFTALDAITAMISNQPAAYAGNPELEALGCDVLERSGAMFDTGKTAVDCLAGGWVDVQPAVADSSSTTGALVTPVVVTMPVDAFLPFRIPLLGGSRYDARATYQVTTGVQYIRSSLVLP